MPIWRPHSLRVGFLPALKIVLLDVRPLLLFGVSLPRHVRLFEPLPVCLRGSSLGVSWLIGSPSRINQANNARFLARAVAKKGPHLARPSRREGAGLLLHIVLLHAFLRHAV